MLICMAYPHNYGCSHFKLGDDHDNASRFYVTWCSAPVPSARIGSWFLGCESNQPDASSRVNPGRLLSPGTRFRPRNTRKLATNMKKAWKYLPTCMQSIQRCSIVDVFLCPAELRSRLEVRRIRRILRNTPNPICWSMLLWFPYRTRRDQRINGSSRSVWRRNHRNGSLRERSMFQPSQAVLINGRQRIFLSHDEHIENQQPETKPEGISTLEGAGAAHRNAEKSYVSEFCLIMNNEVKDSAYCLHQAMTWSPASTARWHLTRLSHVIFTTRRGTRWNVCYFYDEDLYQLGQKKTDG